MNVIIRIKKSEIEPAQTVKIHRFNPRENSWDLICSECIRDAGITIEAEEGDIIRATQRKLNGEFRFAEFYHVHNGFAKVVNYAESLHLRKEAILQVNPQFDPYQLVEWGEFTAARMYDAQKTLIEHKLELAEFLRRTADQLESDDVNGFFLPDWREFVQEIAKWNSIIEADQWNWAYAAGMFHRQEAVERAYRACQA